MSAPTLRAPILPVTLTADAVLFAVIITRRSPALETRLASAVIGAMAAPMISELPFDPFVIARIRGFPLEPHRPDSVPGPAARTRPGTTAGQPAGQARR